MFVIMIVHIIIVIIVIIVVNDAMFPFAVYPFIFGCKESFLVNIRGNVPWWFYLFIICIISVYGSCVG